MPAGARCNDFVAVLTPRYLFQAVVTSKEGPAIAREIAGSFQVVNPVNLLITAGPAFSFSPPCSPLPPAFSLAPAFFLVPPAGPPLSRSLACFALLSLFR